MLIPFLDLKAQSKEIMDEVLPIIEQIMVDCAFIGGPQVDGFEKEFAAFCQTEYCVAVNSGTDALRFALLAAGIGQGHEVITVPNTFIATTEAISQTGAKPVFVDIDPNTSNISADQIESAITGSTKAVIPVHLYGQPADMDAIKEITDRRGIKIIEDACQAHGALYKGKAAGSMGLAGCFSFYPGKNLGGYGEGGAVVTHSKELAQSIRILRDHGQIKKYYHDTEGYNGRLDAIQAAVLRIKLKRLPEWNAARQENAKYYDQLLSKIDGIEIPQQEESVKSVYHLYVIHVDRREDLMKYLNDNGIGTGLHYPLPLHMQKAYNQLGYGKGDFPSTERAAEKLLSLPMYPHLKKEQIEHVCETIKNFKFN